MSVAEIIERIKALSPEEQREISRFVREMTVSDTPAGDFVIRYATDEQVREVGDRIVEEHAELFRKLAE